MKVMITGFVAALVIAFCAPPVLNQFGWSTFESYTSKDSVRLD